MDYFYNNDIPQSEITCPDVLSESDEWIMTYGYNEKTGMYCIGSGSFIHQSDIVEYAFDDCDGIMYIRYDVIRMEYTYKPKFAE